ncbi:MAG: hypothetical protein QOH08_1056 [Chloroflexota bacterium]|nr:hypothetical protein [Chloroflexota bacterium]
MRSIPRAKVEEVPVFWACGVTPQVVLARSGCPWFASHEPGHTLVTDADERIAPPAG